MRNKVIDETLRPWGRYHILSDNKSYKIKRIEINLKGRISYQYHLERSETHGVIIKGKGIVTIEGKIKM